MSVAQIDQALRDFILQEFRWLRNFSAHRHGYLYPPEMMSRLGDLGWFDNQSCFRRERLTIDHFMEDAMRAPPELSALIAAFFLATCPWLTES